MCTAPYCGVAWACHCSPSTQPQVGGVSHPGPSRERVGISCCGWVHASKEEEAKKTCMPVVSVSLFVLSASLSVCPSICVVCQSVCLPICVVCLSVCLSLPICVVCQSVCLSPYLCCLPVCLPICVVCQSVCPSICVVCQTVCSLVIFYMTLCSLFVSVCCMSLPLPEHNVWGVWCCCTRSGGECRWWEGQRWVYCVCTLPVLCKEDDVLMYTDQEPAYTTRLVASRWVVSSPDPT